jgi:hypothetical protein
VPASNLPAFAASSPTVIQAAEVVAAAVTPAVHNLLLAAPAATVAGTQSPQAASPAALVTGAIIKFVTGNAQTQRLTVQLAPEELGTVQISLARNADGGTTVSIIAERTETLALLAGDQPSLQRSLDQAGIPAEGRSLSFSLAAPDPGTGGFGGNAGRSGTPPGPTVSAKSDSDVALSAAIPPPAARVGLVNITA